MRCHSVCSCFSPSLLVQFSVVAMLKLALADELARSDLEPVLALRGRGADEQVLPARVHVDVEVRARRDLAGRAERDVASEVASELRGAVVAALERIHARLERIEQAWRRGDGLDLAVERHLEVIDVVRPGDAEPTPVTRVRRALGMTADWVSVYFLGFVLTTPVAAAVYVFAGRASLEAADAALDAAQTALALAVTGTVALATRRTIGDHAVRVKGNRKGLRDAAADVLERAGVSCFAGCGTTYARGEAHGRSEGGT